jgi:protein TonB
MLVEEEERLEAPNLTTKPFVMPVVETAVPLNMFSDCLLETTDAQRKRRGFAVVFSIMVQSFIVGVLILLPLIFTDVLPLEQLTTMWVVAPPPPPPPPLPAVAIQVRGITTEVVGGQLMAPSIIPTKIKIFHEEEAPAVTGGGVPGGVPGGIPGGQLGGVLGGILSATAKAPPAMPELKRVRVSQGVSEGLLLQKVVPIYPPLARTARVDGVVVLAAIISRNGSIENLHVVSGHPLLISAAIDAVKQWRYRPYLLDGMPVEIETNINVIFSFQNQ